MTLKGHINGHIKGMSHSYNSNDLVKIRSIIFTPIFKTNSIRRLFLIFTACCAHLQCSIVQPYRLHRVTNSGLYALEVPGCHRQLTFAFGRLKKLTFFIHVLYTVKLKCWAPRISRLGAIELLVIFVRPQPFDYFFLT